MALPTSGPLSINDIRVELEASATDQSLGAFSDTAGFTAPDAISDFYGFDGGGSGTGFNSNIGTGFDSALFSIGIKSSSNRLLIGGLFTNFNGNTRNFLVELEFDGIEDTGFYTNLGSGFNQAVRAFDFSTTDGTTTVGGDFTVFNGNNRNRLVKIDTDGNEVTSFYTNLGAGFNSAVMSIKRTPINSVDKMVVGGTFTTLNSLTRNRLVRLNPDGTEDTAFNTNLGTGFNNSVYSATQLSNGQIIVGGSFTTFNGTNRNKIVALNPDGTLSTNGNLLVVGTDANGFPPVSHNTVSNESVNNQVITYTYTFVGQSGDIDATVHKVDEGPYPGPTVSAGYTTPAISGNISDYAFDPPFLILGGNATLLTFKFTLLTAAVDTVPSSPNNSSIVTRCQFCDP